MKSSICEIPYRKAQSGWLCFITFCQDTADQFTSQTFNAIGGAKWRWLSYRRARRVMRGMFSRQRLKEIDEARASKGWPT